MQHRSGNWLNIVPGSTLVVLTVVHETPVFIGIPVLWYGLRAIRSFRRLMG